MFSSHTLVTGRYLILLMLLLPVASFGQTSFYKEIYAREQASHQQISPSKHSSLGGLYAAYDVKYYKLDLILRNDTTYVEGRIRMNAMVSSISLDTIALELVQQQQIDSLFVNGIQALYSRIADTVFIFMNPGLPTGSIFSLDIVYHGTPPFTGFFTGLSTGYYSLWQSHVTWSLSQPWLAKEWWPCKQDLQDKIDSVDISVTTDDVNMVGSNGLLQAVVPLPGNQVRYDWKSRYPIDYYLVSVAVGPFADYSLYAKPEGLNDSILIQNYLFDVPGCLAQYKASIDKTPAYIDLFSKLFGMYPFYKEKYGHCMAYLGGAMEHQTMTTTGDFNPDLISHELAHQWFGDFVTCASWNEIWINEGFATYGTYLARQYTESQAIADAFMQGIRNITLSGPGGSVYIPDSEANSIGRIFDGRLSYNKGAAILHMLRYELQDDSLFFHIMQAFVQQYGNGTARGLDYKAVAENLSGKNLDDYFDQWYFGEGYPTFYLNYLKVGDSLYLRSSQSPSSAVTSLFKMSLEFKILFTGGDTTIRVYQDQALQYFVLPFAHDISGLVVDPSASCLLKVGGIQEGIDEISRQPLIHVYPNPASTTITIIIQDQPHVKHNFVINDCIGRTLRSWSDESVSIEIDLTDLAAGVYFLSTSIAGSQCRQMFIKK